MARADHRRCQPVCPIAQGLKVRAGGIPVAWLAIERPIAIQNLVGALKICMGMIGAYNIREMHRAEMVIAPAIKTEGKHFQLGGH